MALADKYCPIVLGVSVEMLGMLVVGVVFSLLHNAPYAYLPFIVTVGITTFAVYLERQKDRCEWAAELPSRRVVLYLLLFVPSFIAYSLGGWGQQLVASWWVVAPLVIFVLPLAATLTIHQRVEHSSGSGAVAPRALVLASRLPLLLLALYCILLVVALIFGSRTPPN